MVMLYHATNLYSVRQMTRTGYIGLCEADYRRLAHKIARATAVDVGLFESFIQELHTEDQLEKVSFFQSLDTTQHQACRIAEFGGEARGCFVRQCLKRAARRRGVPWKSFHPLFRLAGRQTETVVVCVAVPRPLIANPEMLGHGHEIYTKGRVPAQHIRDVVR